MKKALVFGLSLAMLLSLAACHKPQTDQQEPSQPDPATTSAPADVSTPAPIEDTPKTEPPATPTPEPLSEKITIVSSENEDIQEPAEEVQLFEAVEGGGQTVYATGTVNIRSIWSIEGEKLGTLSKGEEVERVGIGKEGSEAEGWSQVRISDGQAEDGVERFRLVYVSSKYLSTTKPASSSSQAQSTTSKPSTTKPSTSTQTQASKPAEKPAETQQQQQQSTDAPNTVIVPPKQDKPADTQSTKTQTEEEAERQKKIEEGIKQRLEWGWYYNEEGKLCMPKGSNPGQGNLQ